MSRADPPRILQFCHGYDGPFLDCARQYAVLFEGSGYKVTTVYLSGPPDVEVERGSASDEVIFLGYGSAEMRGLKLGAMAALRRLVKGRDFRLCIAHRFKPTYIALLATRLPVIGVSHAFDVYRRRSRRLLANLFRNRLTLLGVSDAVRDDIRSCLPGWPSERIQTLHNRIDVEALRAELLDRAAARTQLGLPADAWVLGNVGRLHPDKDQATLIRGFATALPSLPAGSLLVIMGKGRLEAKLKALAVELGVAAQVRFLGQVAHARRYFGALDAFALTSDYEPFGMVLLEAMVAQVPVICSDCGGGPEVVGDAGLLFPLRDEQTLARRIEQVARLDYARLAACRVAMRQRLEASFSDQAARRLFWSQHFAPVRLPAS